MTDYWEFADRLRTLARQYEEPSVFMPIVKLAEEYELRAEQLEMQLIVQRQRDWVEQN